MADEISKIQTNGTTYDVKDATARETAEYAEGTAETAQSVATGAQDLANDAVTEAQHAQSTAETAQSTAEAVKDSIPTKVSELDNDVPYATQDALDVQVNNLSGAIGTAVELADMARESANSKVSSVNIGSVTTGDEPSVTNSGTDKDVTLDFVFPSGGVLTGTVEAGGTLSFTGEMVVAFFICDEYATYSAMIFSQGVPRAGYIDPYEGEGFSATVSDGIFAVSAEGRQEFKFTLIGATLVE